MKDEISVLLTNKLVSTAAALWSASGQLEILDNVSNFVYQYQSDDTWRILRITHSSHRSEDQIIAELDWINYLFEQGISVSRPILSNYQQFTERFPVNDSYFTAVSFEYAPGQLIENADPDEWNPALFQSLGRIMGNMHRVSKTYNPHHLKQRREEWREDELIKNTRLYLPLDQRDAADKLEQILSLFNQKPCTPDDYGLIHSDLNPTNFHVLDGKITLFDFDDCAYNWFINDIAVAMPLYSSMFSRPNWEDKLTEFVSCFMHGYHQKNDLAPAWLDFLPTCMRLQNLITLVAMHEANVPGSQYHSFYEMVLKTYREGHPLFDFDFRKAAETIRF